MDSMSERYRFAALAFLAVSVTAQMAYAITDFTDTSLFVLMAFMAVVSAAAEFHMFERYSKTGGNGAQAAMVGVAFVVTFAALVVDVIKLAAPAFVFGGMGWWLPLLSFVNCIVSVACYLLFGLFSDSHKTARTAARHESELLSQKLNAAYQTPKFVQAYERIAHVELTRTVAKRLGISLHEASALIAMDNDTVPGPTDTAHSALSAAEIAKLRNMAAQDFLARQPVVSSNGNGHNGKI